MQEHEQKVTVKPAEGRQVRKENGQVIDAAGEHIILNGYYRRRINDGDLIKVADKKTSKAAVKPVDLQGDK